MKTRCSNCQTTFRVTPDQLKARAGKVRCGQCQTVFNALDCLLEETPSSTAQAKTTPAVIPRHAPPAPTPPPAPRTEVDLPAFVAPTPPPQSIDAHQSPNTQREPTLTEEKSSADSDISDTQPGDAPDEDMPPLSEEEAQALGKATGLILPRETTEIPGYSKWSEGVMNTQLSLPEEKVTRWPFVIVALLLMIVLAGQLVFCFRSEIATLEPRLRTPLASFSKLFDAELPLPSRAELVSIETSDLQTDTAHGNLLVLTATVRNRANFAQAYPALELSLTDALDTAIARRVFLPSEYLSPKTPIDQPFAPNTDISVHLWLEAKELTAAGYRLYVFYP